MTRAARRYFRNFSRRDRPSDDPDAWEEAEELETPDERHFFGQMVEKKYRAGSRLDEREMRRLYGYLARTWIPLRRSFFLEELN